MQGTVPRCWLEEPDGRRHAVGPRGLLIGRSPAADILLQDPKASRRGALAYLDPSGPQLVRLGRGPVQLNGGALHGCQPVSQGDRITFPGVDLVVHVAESPGEAATGWVLRFQKLGNEGRPHVHFTPLPRSTFAAGGGPEDDLLLEGWPAAAVELAPAPPGGWQAALGQGVRLNGRLAPEDGTALLRSGDDLSFEGERLRLVDMASGQQTTMGEDRPDLPWQVALQPVPPAGGRLEVHIAHRTRSSWIPGLRFDLLQVLLEPLGRTAPGEPVSDAVALARVWGRQLPKDPKAVNTLVKRLRRDLVQAGLCGRELIERSHGRTRFMLAPEALVEVAKPR